MSIRLVLADDHSIVLEGLHAFLGLERDLHVVALCTDGHETVAAVRQHRPDVLVLDAAMPGLEGLEALDALREDGPSVATVILTASLDDQTLLGFMQRSVEGIVLKESAASDLVDAIRAAARGRRWFGPEITARSLALMARPQPDGGDPLTPRERQVVVEVAQGNSNRRVADELGIAESTVKLHLRKAFDKLNVANRTQLSLLARSRGWID